MHYSEMLGSQKTTISIWLSNKSAGNALDIGCREGDRAKILALRLGLSDRKVIALDWSGEHRISPKQRKPIAKFDVGRICEDLDNVTVLNMDPAFLPFDYFQPLTFTFIDYDYALTGVRRITEAVIKAMDWTGEKNAVLAWAGYRKPKPYTERDGTVTEEPNDVVNYVNSLELADTYHFEGSEIAFKVFNPTVEFRQELRELSRI